MVHAPSSWSRTPGGMLGFVQTPFAPLVATHDPEEFLAAPVGRCIVGATFAIWCHSPELQGSIVWGELDERTIREMFAIGRFIERPEFDRPRRSLSDVHAIERADADVVMGFVQAARARVADWSNRIERHALIVPAGFGGVLLSGALPLAGAEYPLRVTTDVDTAVAFVGHPAVAAVHAAVANIVAATRGRSALLSRLRAQLGRELETATINSSATALGMSTRTLQRELHRLDTSFTEELHRLRLHTAETLLVHTDLKIEAIANQVGFGTASRMSASLRRAVKLTASELRAERRAERPA